MFKSYLFCAMSFFCMIGYVSTLTPMELTLPESIVEASQARVALFKGLLYSGLFLNDEKTAVDYEKAKESLEYAVIQGNDEVRTLACCYLAYLCLSGKISHLDPEVLKKSFTDAAFALYDPSQWQALDSHLVLENSYDRGVVGQYIAAANLYARGNSKMEKLVEGIQNNIERDYLAQVKAEDLEKPFAHVGAAMVVQMSKMAGLSVDLKCYCSPLLWAVAFGYQDIIEMLVNEGANVNSYGKGDKGPLPLCQAIDNGNLELVKLLTAHGALLDLADEGGSPLCHAVKKGDEDVILFLLEGGALESQPLTLEASKLLLPFNDSTGFSELIGAIEDGKLPAAEMLLAKVRKVLALVLPLGFSALHSAAWAGSVTLVKQLLKEGAPINAKNSYGETPLFIALSRHYLSPHYSPANQLKVCEVLVEAGASLNDVDSENRNLLFSAAASGNRRLVDFLISRGLKLERAARSSKGSTLVHAAAQSMCIEMVEYLVERGADMHSCDNEGRDMVFYAVQAASRDRMNDFRQFLRFLLLKGLSLNHLDKYGKTPLYYVISSGEDSAWLIEILLEEGAHGMASRDNSTLHELLKYYGKDQAKIKPLFEKFVKAGADVHARDSEERTLLHCAVELENEDLARYLVSCGAHPHAKDKNGRTPFILALESGNKKLWKLLMGDLDVKSFITVQAKNDESWDSLHCAAAAGNIAAFTLWLYCNTFRATSYPHFESGVAALHYAAYRGNKKMAALLLAYGSDNMRNGFDVAIKIQEASRGGGFWYGLAGKHERAALEMSERRERERRVRRWEIPSRKMIGWTPLRIAVNNGFTELVDLFISHGANIHEVHEGETLLHVAAKEGHCDMVQKLLNLGLDIDAQTEDAFSPLDCAVSRRHKEVVKALIVRGSNLSRAKKYTNDPELIKILQDAEDAENGFSEIHLAARDRRIDDIIRLIQEGVNIDLASIKEQLTALHIAARDRNEKMVQLLLEKGACTSCKDIEGNTPLHYVAQDAAQNGAEEIVGMLLSQPGIDVAIANRYGFTALDLAVKEAARYSTNASYIRVIELLFSRCTHIENLFNSGRNLLYWACGRSLKVVERLLFMGVDVTVLDDPELIPLHRAVEAGSEEIVLLLLENGADVHALLGNGRTVLHTAAMSNRLNRKRMIELMLSRGFLINAKDNQGYTPLHYAAVNSSERKYVALNSSQQELCMPERMFEIQALGEIEALGFLLEKEADIHAVDNDGKTSLHRAISSHTGLEVIEWLIAHGALINVRDKKGSTPLHKAIKRGQMKIVQVLLSHGADVNAQNEDGSTPLHIAVLRSHFKGGIEIVRLLIDKGAICSLRTNRGMTALDIMRQIKGGRKAEDLLEDAEFKQGMMYRLINALYKKICCCGRAKDKAE